MPKTERKVLGAKRPPMWVSLPTDFEVEVGDIVAVVGLPSGGGFTVHSPEDRDLDIPFYPLTVRKLSKFSKGITIPARLARDLAITPDMAFRVTPGKSIVKYEVQRGER